MERRLAAILAADVVGYTRLIRADEEGTLARLKALRSALVDPPIAAHGGRMSACSQEETLGRPPARIDSSIVHC